MNCRWRCDGRQRGKQGEAGPGLEVERQLGVEGQEEGGTQPGGGSQPDDGSQPKGGSWLKDER